jgi:ribonuclease HII
VVAAVILEDLTSPKLLHIRDSKELSESKRESLFALIMEVATSVSIIEISPGEIDERGVHAANLDGMRRAVKGLTPEPAYVLTDGYAIAGLAIPNVAVWKGDQVVTAISAASIIAKVTRDRIMREMDLEFPQYGFAGHKGYITAAHTKALNEHGPCAQHRRSFANVAALIHK